MKYFFNKYYCLLIIAFVIINQMPVKAIGWVAKANYGGTSRQFAVGFSIGSKGYIGTGSDISGARNDFWEYDPATNAWTQKTNFGGTARMQAVGFAIGTKGYIGTGLDFNGSEKDFWEYNPTTNSWTQKADFGGVSRSRAVGFNILDKGYIGTGINSSSSTSYTDFWEYNPATNTWTQKTNFGGAARYNATGFSIGNKGYLGTGYDGSNFKADFWQYEPSANTWTQKANIGSAQWASVSFSIGSKGYVGIGYGIVGLLKAFWEYDTISNSWIRDVDFGGSSRYAAVGFAIGTKGYAGIGQDPNGSTKDFWEFEPTYIRTGTIQINKFCVGSPAAIPINVPYTTTTKLNAGNVFTAQLSDSSGSFASPLNIGSITDTLGDTISAIIPANQIFGTKYRIRVVSSSPSYIGQDNGTNLSITPYPQVSFTVDDTLQCLTANIFNLTNTTTLAYGTLAQSVWSFGDGLTETKLNTVHSFKTDDTYNIRLVCTTKAGCKDSASAQVIVEPSPITSFGVNDTIQCLKNNNFNFFNLSTINKGSLTYSWDFGNSVTSNTSNPSYSYLANGNYNVRLTATSGLGCSNTYILKGFVKPEPVALFTVNDSIQCLTGNTFNFTNNSSIAVDTFSSLWDFGDTNNSSNFSVNHSYNDTGNFLVKLVLNSTFGCLSNFERTVSVYNNPLILSAIPAEKCGPGKLALSATAKNGNIAWYNADSGGVLLGSGSVYITDTLYKSKIYYVEASNIVCASARTDVTATIIDIPPVQLTTISDTSYGPDSLTLYAKSAQGDVQWYDSDTGGTLLFTGNYFTTPWLTATTTYYAEAVDRGCYSGVRTAVKAYILPVSINKYSSAVEFTIYPNPSKDFIKIAVRGISGKTSLSIVDIQGRIKLNKEILPSAGQYNELLDVTDLAEGMYFIILENSQLCKIVRFGKI
jgi:PKD repeat protein